MKIKLSTNLTNHQPYFVLKKPWKLVTTSLKSRTKMSLICSRQLFLSSLKPRKNTIGNVEHLSCSKLFKMEKRMITSQWIRNRRKIQRPWRSSKGRRRSLRLLIALLSWFWWPLLQFTPCFLMISEAWESIWHMILCFMDSLVLPWPCLLWRLSFQVMLKISISIRFSFGLTWFRLLPW